MEVEHGPLNDHFPLTNSIWFFQGVYAPSPATTELSTGRPAQASKASMESFLHRRNLGVDVFFTSGRIQKEGRSNWTPLPHEHEQ